MAVPYLSCMLVAASFYNLPPRVLPSIQAVEGGKPGLVHQNTNGTPDLGIMQVNTLWIPRLAKSTGMSKQQTREKLLNDSCFNIAAAGAIVRLALYEARGDLMTAVAYYHSHTPHIGATYQKKVLAAANTLFVKNYQR